jgi:hypothetical protein
MSENERPAGPEEICTTPVAAKCYCRTGWPSTLALCRVTLCYVAAGDLDPAAAAVLRGQGLGPRRTNPRTRAAPRPERQGTGP